MIHWALHGDRDSFRGLRFDLSGTRWSPIKPTLLAHKDHSYLLWHGLDLENDLKLETLDFYGVDLIRHSNATVQTWAVNRS